ncbi:MAG: membrane protein insertase YidC [Gammaproteobacteria bacterium]|jgi:YidC/Oxa1 family membrane protein insertase
MDRIRFGLWFGLLASVWISYTTWVTENQPDPPVDGAADASTQVADDLPPVAMDTDVPELGSDVGDLPGQAPAGSEAGERRLISVRTDVLDLAIDLNGGDLVRADVSQYPVDKANPDIPVRLLDYDPDNVWVFQTGLIGREGAAAPTHEQPFVADQDSYSLTEDADSLEVRLRWAGPDGLSAEKVYTFRRGQYAIDLDLIVRNAGPEDWPTVAYAQMRRLHNSSGRKFLNVDSYSFTGPVLYDGDEYTTIDFDDLAQAPVDQVVVDGWLASIQHHFLAAIVPLTDEPTEYEARTFGSSYRLRALSPSKVVAAGGELDYPLKLFVGPKLQEQLNAAAPGRELRLTVDYGMLTVLSYPLFLVLDFIHGFVGNWGLAIILTTFLIKLVFYKLTATSGRSMAKMRKLAPRMKALQEKHKEDRQALSQAMMDLYKKEKVNPAAGCLPILVQMPFFFAFYWVLIESVEMRQAPFALWINDLSVRDPFFILPLLMGGAMLFQMRLNPAPPDPVQARVMQIMPIAFTAMFAFFPAGLVLYWLTNTLVSIAQQWRINQLVARES